MSGLEPCGEARTMRPGLRWLMSSGYATHLTSERLRQAGPSGVVDKPASPRVLLEAIRAALDETTDGAPAA